MSNVPILRLSLSDNLALEQVLSDIPFFCVGLTAIAVFAFFLVMRRVNIAAIYLYSSSLFAFGAAILDLTQVLIRGVANTNNGLALTTVTGITNAREIGLALSFGFRYIFLWAFVAQRPRYEPRPQTLTEPPFTDDLFHSASWERWGLFGFILKWGLLGSIISIPILQIVWRIVTGSSSVYVAESTIQIVVSVLLITKLMLNLFLSNVAPWWRPFVPYIVPFVALMISAGVGAGNLLFFGFSETTVGRFLQAVELYGLILSVLIFTFYGVPKRSAPPAPRKRSSFFAGFAAPKSDSEPPVTEAPVPENGREISSPDMLQLSISPRESVVSRMSTWINIRRAPRPNSEQKLWNSSEAELGISTQVRVPSPAPSAQEQASPRVQITPEESWILPTANPETPKTDTQSILVPPGTVISEPGPGTPSTMMSRPFTGVSFASYYGLASNSRLTMPGVLPDENSRETDSPVYGLNGITAGSAIPAAVPDSPVLSVATLKADNTTSDQRDSSNSFDELLRQQTELDKSIAALRLFSPTTTITTLPPVPDSENKQSTVSTGRSPSVSSGKSVSNRSEFSLSIFPEPPPVNQSLQELSPERSRLPIRGRRQSRVPRSATSEVNEVPVPEHQRLDSAGTQYDVTSFIGDLTSPIAEPSKLSDLPEESDMESPALRTSTLRPLLLTPAAAAITSLPPTNGTSSQTPPSSYEYPVLKPLLLGSAPPSSSMSSPLSATRRAPQSRRPGQPRPFISIPRQMGNEEDRVDDEFEKPRRPPALVKSEFTP
ncbi:hypothetical protein C8J57DRAFT_15517 [Mycena rebaudengoi]|nr:hypothetical protein C8J57DRAFT_15517 [Mycena rebaudengoi]